VEPCGRGSPLLSKSLLNEGMSQSTVPSTSQSAWLFGARTAGAAGLIAIPVASCTSAAAAPPIPMIRPDPMTVP